MFKELKALIDGKNTMYIRGRAELRARVGRPQTS